MSKKVRKVSFWSWLGGGGRRREVVALDPYDIPVMTPVEAASQVASTLPRFQESASDTVRTGVSPKRMRLRSAFTPSQPVSDVRMFAGRRKILHSLIRAIEDQQMHVVVYGDRGIGKTSMLHVLSHLAHEVRYIVRYTSCSEGSDFSETFRAIAKDIPLLYHADTDPTSAAAESGGVLADLLPTGQLTVSQIGEMFTKLTGVRVLIILDEFDRSGPDFRRWTAELIKNLSDRSTRVQIVIAGVAANLTELIEFIPSIRRNIIGLAMPNMTPEEIEELVTIGALAAGLPFSDAALRDIVRHANGSPHLASLLGQHAGVAALDRGAISVGVEDVAFALDQAFAEVEVRISPQSRHQIAQITDPEILALLVEVAGEALNDNGHIAEPTLIAGADQSPRAKRIGQLTDDDALLVNTPNAPGGGFAFREDGVALYVWLLGARNPTQHAH